MGDFFTKTMRPEDEAETATGIMLRFTKGISIMLRVKLKNEGEVVLEDDYHRGDLYSILGGEIKSWGAGVAIGCGWLGCR